MNHIVGHKTQRDQLQSDLNSGSINHAYFFVGPQSIGKYALAKAFAQELQTRGKENKEEITRHIANNTHLDTYVFENENNIISIKDIRDIQEYMTRSFDSQYRILLLQDIERMPIPAQNAFLKILEEPPKNTIFLLTCSHIGKILSTILSRVQVVKMSVLSDEKICTYLEEEFSIAPEKSKKIAYSAQGRVGTAKSLAESADALEEEISKLEQIQAIVEKKNLIGAFNLADEASKDTQSSKQTLQRLLVVLRNKLHSSPTTTCAKHIESVCKSFQYIDQNINKKLVLETAFLEPIS